MFDFIGIGEILIDFTPAGVNGPSALFQQNLGGAVTNVACAMAKFGWRSGFIGKAGNDGFGLFCAKTLRDTGVDISGLQLSAIHETTLAFVQLSNTGDRSFTFYRKNAADVSLETAEVNLEMVENTRIFHFGGVSLTDEPARSATLYAVQRAKEAGALIAFDPNLRLNLWNNSAEAQEVLLDALPLADVIKFSEDEQLFLFDTIDESVLYNLYKRLGTKMLVLTRAEKGATAFLNGRLFNSRAYEVEVVDTTGAGDCFLAGVLHGLLKLDKSIEAISIGETERLLSFANAAGSLVCRGKGVVNALPSLVEVEELLQADYR